MTPIPQIMALAKSFDQNAELRIGRDKRQAAMQSVLAWSLDEALKKWRAAMQGSGPYDCHGSGEAQSIRG